MTCYYQDVGHRLSGSPQADMAVRWGEVVMREAGFDSVWLQPVMVQKWVRGQKECWEILGVGGRCAGIGWFYC